LTRRRFNKSEHVALFIAADGNCTVCGIPLPDSFHADHIVPYSRDGETDVVNGQALCAACNLKKGDRCDENDVRFSR
jgi:5-methylcytosine-specific restriction endonuclease McrA